LPDKQADNFDYSGRETLTDLTKAKNYNDHLAQKIQAHYEIDSTVLDFGAGNGHFLSLLQSKPARFLAIEPDQKLQAEIEGKSVAEVLNPNELEQSSVNFIYTLNVLEHIEQDTQTLKSFHRWLEKGGFSSFTFLQHLTSTASLMHHLATSDVTKRPN
jgi:2-polyprenyl-3-methyl-5-hydroxy-6-metoxy-1,4-benzoquinol methylase